MTQLLDIDMAVDAISCAFDALRCVVKIYDSKARKIRYKVFGDVKTAVAGVTGVQVRHVPTQQDF